MNKRKLESDNYFDEELTYKEIVEKQKIECNKFEKELKDFFISQMIEREYNKLVEKQENNFVNKKK